MGRISRKRSTKGGRKIRKSRRKTRRKTRRHRRRGGRPEVSRPQEGLLLNRLGVRELEKCRRQLERCEADRGVDAREARQWDERRRLEAILSNRAESSGVR